MTPEMLQLCFKPMVLLAKTTVLTGFYKRSCPSPMASTDKRSVINSEYSHQRFSGILQALPDSFICFAESGELLQINPTSEKQFGWKTDTVIGQSVFDLLIPNSDPHPLRAQIEKLEIQSGDTEKHCRFDCEFPDVSGNLLPFEITLLYQKIDQTPVISAFLREISKLKKYENENRTLNENFESKIELRTRELSQAVTKLELARQDLENAQAIAGVGDSVYFPTSGVRIWSKQTFALYGFPHDNQPPDHKQILGSVYIRDLQYNREVIEASISGTEPTEGLEYRVVHSDGSVHWLHVVSHLEKEQEGVEEHMVSIIKDITKQKAVEEEMVRAIERERELGQLKTDFLNMISHEYRTPLGIINSSADILARYQNRMKEEDKLSRITDIKQSDRRLADLVEEVLFMGKSDSGKMKINYRPIDYPAVVKDVSDTIVAHFGFPRDVIIEVQDLPEDCEIDEQILRHILNNAISNALKYSTLDKPVNISIQSIRNGVQITIKDQGIGIPKEDQKKLFGMFHRASNVGTISGTGLGLVILKRCIDLLKGRVSLSSTPGKGTDLSLWFPEKGPKETQ